MPTYDTGRVRLYLIWLLVLVGLVPWRTEVYYSGGVDPVVAAKGMLAVFALMLAWLAADQAPRRNAVGARSFTIVVAFATTTALGGWATGSLLTSLVLSTRVLLVAGIVVLVLMTYPLGQVVRTLCAAMGMVGLVAAATGVGSIASEGRLYGGLLPLNPNQIAFLIGVPFLGLVWRIVHHQSHRYDVLALFLLGGVTWLTGSRTGLVALGVGAVVIVLQAHRISAATFLALVCAVPAFVFIVFSTDIAADYLSRGDSQSVGSLSSRTIAWSAAFSMDPGAWQHWFGGGYSVKTVAVSGTYWDTQVLDSSWVSAYVQSGLMGMALLGLWALTSLVAAFRCTRPWRGLLSALIVFCLIRSFTQSGLLDAQLIFVVFLVASVAAEYGTRAARES